MGYKQLYLESQVRFSKKLKLLQSKYNNIRCAINNLSDSIDNRRSEISPELHSYLSKEFGEIIKLCSDMTYNFDDYYNENSQI